MDKNFLLYLIVVKTATSTSNTSLFVSTTRDLLSFLLLIHSLKTYLSDLQHLLCFSQSLYKTLIPTAFNFVSLLTSLFWIRPIVTFNTFAVIIGSLGET